MSPSILAFLADAGAAVAGLLARQVVLSAVVFAVAVGLCWLLHHRLPHLQYGLWCLVFLRLLLPTDLSHPLSAGHLLARLGARVPSADAAPQGVGLEDRAVTPGRGRDGFRAAAGAGVPGWMLAAVVVWLAGAVVAATRYRCRVAACRRVLAETRPVESLRVLRLAEEWRTRLRVRRSVRLVTAPRTVSPFVAGLLRPTIFIPEVVLQRDEEIMLEAIIAHEMAHVARWDTLWVVLQQTIQIFYFFDPLVWISGARLGGERERLCDVMVLGCGSIPPGSYARSILKVAEMKLGGVAHPAMARSSGIARRIRSILEVGSRGSQQILAAIIVAALGVILLPLAGGSRTTSGEAASHLSGDLRASIPVEQAEEGAVDERPLCVADLVNPLPGGRVSQRFGDGRNAFSGEVQHHDGIDVAATMGTPILAPSDGVVEVATERYEGGGRWGTVLIFDHGNGLRTRLAHLGAIEVEAGQAVTAGQRVARVGSTGLSTGPHLHFEVLCHGEPQDPARYVAAWR